MAARALIGYRNATTDAVTSLSIELAGANPEAIFDETTVVAWAHENTPAGYVLQDVRYAPDFEQVYPIA